MSDAASTTLKKGDATRGRILEEALQQASVRGLAAVSLNDVADAVGLSKSGVFKHFQAKEALHLAVMETAVARFVAECWTPAATAPRGRPRVDQMFKDWLNWSEGYWRGGCPLMTAARELDQQPGELRDYVQNSLRQWDETVAHTLSLLTDPPADPVTARQASFELTGVMLAYKHAASMGDPDARAKAVRGYQTILARFGQS